MQKGVIPFAKSYKEKRAKTWELDLLRLLAPDWIYLLLYENYISNCAFQPLIPYLDSWVGIPFRYFPQPKINKTQTSIQIVPSTDHSDLQQMFPPQNLIIHWELHLIYCMYRITAY